MVETNVAKRYFSWITLESHPNGKKVDAGFTFKILLAKVMFGWALQCSGVLYKLLCNDLLLGIRIIKKELV